MIRNRTPRQARKSGCRGGCAADRRARARARARTFSQPSAYSRRSATYSMYWRISRLFMPMRSTGSACPGEGRGAVRGAHWCGAPCRVAGLAAGGNALQSTCHMQQSRCAAGHAQLNCQGQVAPVWATTRVPARQQTAAHICDELCLNVNSLFDDLQHALVGDAVVEHAAGGGRTA